MTTRCCAPPSAAPTTRRYRVTLWVALVVNVAMFVVEVAGGLLSDSAALLADALDFLSDAANYAITLVVVGLGLQRQTQAAMFKALCMCALGSYVVGRAVWSATSGSTPHAETMGVIAIAALFANASVAAAFYRWREGDANMRAVWLCSRNDALGNVAVFAAALVVAASGTRWADLFVALAIGAMNVHAGWIVFVQARGERAGRLPPTQRGPLVELDAK